MQILNKRALKNCRNSWKLAKWWKFAKSCHTAANQPLWSKIHFTWRQCNSRYDVTNNYYSLCLLKLNAINFDFKFLQSTTLTWITIAACLLDWPQNLWFLSCDSVINKVVIQPRRANRTLTKVLYLWPEVGILDKQLIGVLPNA